MSLKNFEGIKRNIPLLYIFSFLIKRPMMPIITLYYLFFNLSFTQIGIIAGATAVTTLILEIPSGIVTDYIGKRTALILASIIGLISQLFYYIGNNFTHFLIAGIIFGISVSFISGSRQSLLFETVKKLGKEKLYKKYHGRMIFYGFITSGIVLLAVPFIYEANKKAVFLIGMAFFLVATIIAILLKEIEEKNTNNIFSHIKESFVETIRNKNIRFAIFYNMIGTGLMFLMVDYFQPIMKESGIIVIYFGLMYFLMRVTMAFGSRLAHAVEKYFSNRSIVLITLITFIIAIFGFTTFNIFVVIVLIAIMRFSEGVQRVAITDEIQQNISRNNRTTISSISNMYRNGYHMIIAPILGILTDGYGLGIMLICLGSFYIVITLLFILIKPNPKSKPI